MKLATTITRPARSARPQLMADASPKTSRSSDLYSHIACCVEESRGSRLALAEAARLRVVASGRLSIVHVFEAVPAAVGLQAGRMGLDVGWVVVNDEAEETMTEWLRELAGATGGDPVMLHGGSPAATACAWADSEAVGLLVVGGLRGRLGRVLRGDFTSWVVAHARSPVLVVKSD